MQVQTFLGKVSMDGLHQMDEHITHWLESKDVEPTFVTQSFGYEQPHEGGKAEPVIVTTVWY